MKILKKNKAVERKAHLKKQLINQMHNKYEPKLLSKKKRGTIWNKKKNSQICKLLHFVLNQNNMHK